MGTRTAILVVSLVALSPAYEVRAEIASTSGTVAVEPNPHAAPADDVIFVFTEQRSVAFVSTQPLEFGSIAPGTLIDSHYLQFDPSSPSGVVGAGSVTFDGPILGVATSTDSLTVNLSPDVDSTSDVYFGLEGEIGPYPPGADPGARGLGSPEDDLVITIGSPILVVDSLEIPEGAPGNVDGLRVFTASAAPVPIPSLNPMGVALFGGLVVAVAGLALRRRRGAL
jgi:hypothetical protein